MSNKKNVISFAVMLLLMAGTGFYLLHNQPIASLTRILSQVKPGYILLGLGLMVVFVGCEAMCTKLSLSKLGHKTPFRRCMGYSFVGFYFSSITPSSTGGQPAQVYYMTKDNIPAAHGTLDMLLITVCYQVSTLLFGLAAFLIRPQILTDLGGGLRVLLLYGAVTTLALTAAILTVMFAPKLADRMCNGILNLLVRVRLIKNREKAQEKLDHQIGEYRRGADCLKCHPGLMPALLGLSLLQILALYLVPFVVYRAFGLSGYTAVELVAVQALLTVAVSTLPLPGAVGPSEGGFIKAFTLFFGAGLVTPAMLVSRGISFYAFLLVSGVITLLVHVSAGRKARAAQHGDAPLRAAVADKLPKPGRAAASW